MYDEEAVITIGDGNIGRVFHYVNGKFDLHQRCYKMADFKALTAKYFYYYFSTKFYERAMSMTAKATVDSVRLEMISDMEIKFPKSTIEQTNISELLTNLDNLITLHQRKCNCFSNSWEQRKLGEIGNTFTGLSGKKKEDFGHGDAKFVTYMNVFSNPISNFKQVESVEIDSKQNEIKYGDIFFTTSSETPEEVGMPSIWLENKRNYYLNSFCFGFRPSLKFDPYFAAYMLRTSNVRNKITLLAQGISRYNISKTQMMNIEVPFPKDSEQIKLGKLFVEIDNLITLHQHKELKRRKDKNEHLRW